jgi:copper/silver efflux system protein
LPNSKIRPEVAEKGVSRVKLTKDPVHGAVKRIRPKFMTVATDFIGLVPILWVTGTGSDVMKRISAPLIGGVFTSFLLELLVYPALYEIWKWYFELKRRSSHELAELQEVPSS